MPTLLVECVPAQDGIPVAPCGTFDGVALTPVVLDVDASGYDFADASEIFAWSFTLVMLAWLTGLGIGAIMRVIRSA